MEERYPKLRRPKRRLSYITNRENATKQWEGKLSLGDVDKMFDDLDSFTHVEVLPPSLLLEVSDGDKKQEERDAFEGSHKSTISEEIPKCPMVAEEVIVRTASPKPVDLDIPFKGHGPMKTSSPIEGNAHKERDDLVSPILFVFEEEEQEEAKAAQEQQCNGHITEKCGDSEFESPPSKIVISRPKSSQKNKTSAAWSDQQELKEPASEKEWKPAVTTTVGKDMSSFLQRLKEAIQPSGQPPVLKKMVSPVKVPIPPGELEEDFVILEDDAPARVSIPHQSITRQRKNKTSSSDKSSSTDKSTKESIEDPAQEQPELSQRGRRHRNQTAGRKIRKSLQGSDGSKETASVEDVKEQNHEQMSVEHPAVQDQEHLSDKDPGKCETHTVDDLAKEAAKQSSQPAESGVSLPEDNQVLEKRKRTLPGEWLQVPQSSKETKARDSLLVLKKPKQSQKEPSVAAASSPVEAKTDSLSEAQSPGGKRLQKAKKKKIVVNKIKSTKTPTQKKKTAQVEETTDVAEKDNGLKQPNQSPTSQSTKTTTKKKLFQDKKKTTRKNATNKKSVKKLMDAAEQEQPDVPDVPDVPDMDSKQSSPLEFPQRDHSLSSGDLFHRTYDHSSTGKTSRTPSGCSEKDVTPELRKRKRKPPGNWWRVDNMSEDEVVSSQRQTCQPRKARRSKQKRTPSKQIHSPEARTPTRDSMLFSSSPLEGAATPPRRQLQMEAPKTVKSSLATFKDIFTSHTKSTHVISGREAAQNVSVCSGPTQVMATDHSSPTKNINIVPTDNIEFNRASLPESRNPSHNTLTILSGPSSMIDRGEDEDTGLQPSRESHAGLSVSDLCAPPLKPLSLQAKDKANLSEWFKTLWSSPMNNSDGAEITPDHFDWYFYQGRAIGIQEDLCCESISNGKLLLGSNMKKPLWVDHSATTVFNILTGSVCVSIDCTDSLLKPGQSFMVQLGHAYSIQNLTAQPAVLYFTRIAESKDEAW